ncbi:MAG: (2Fe-2S)-binding protein [Actinobacteria bacterium]|nr:(2Fe-2S)-binding protein [Actinomycetota bacterium]
MNALHGGPVAVTFARLRHLDEHLAAEVGQPEGSEWYSLDTVVSGGHLDSWLESLVREKDGQRDVAGAYLGSWLTGALVSVPVSALVLERRVPHVGAGLWLHRHQEGWFDRVAFASARVDVLADDPQADHPDAVVLADEATLADRYAESLVETLTPLLEAVRRGAAYGLRGLWGAVADDITGTALRVARQTGTDGWAAWNLSQAVLDHLAARQTLLRRRPTPFPVTWRGGEALFQVKGTCCLYYKTHDGPLDPDGDSYCITCPFRYDDNRLSRLRRQLEHPE